jgi:hypothetical protein
MKMWVEFIVQTDIPGTLQAPVPPARSWLIIHQVLTNFMYIVLKQIQQKLIIITNK